MAVKANSKTKSLSGTAYRAARMAKGYGRESLATALGTTMAAVAKHEAAEQVPAEAFAAVAALPMHGNPLKERKEPVTKQARTRKGTEAIEALAKHPVTVARVAMGYTREALAQALGTNGSGLRKLESTPVDSPQAKADAKTVTALGPVSRTDTGKPLVLRGPVVLTRTPAQAKAKSKATRATQARKAKAATASDLI